MNNRTLVVMYQATAKEMILYNMLILNIYKIYKITLVELIGYRI